MLSQAYAIFLFNFDDLVCYDIKKMRQTQEFFGCALLRFSVLSTEPDNANDVSSYCKGAQVNAAFRLTSTRLFKFLLPWQP